MNCELGTAAEEEGGAEPEDGGAPGEAAGAPLADPSRLTEGVLALVGALVMGDEDDEGGVLALLSDTLVAVGDAGACMKPLSSCEEAVVEAIDVELVDEAKLDESLTLGLDGRTAGPAPADSAKDAASRRRRANADRIVSRCRGGDGGGGYGGGREGGGRRVRGRREERTTKKRPRQSRARNRGRRQVDIYSTDRCGTVQSFFQLKITRAARSP